LARDPTERRVPLTAGLFSGGLSSRLLGLTVVFVMVSQALIFVPTLAQFEDRWLLDRVRAAEVASLAVEAATNQMVPDVIAAELREGAGVESVAIKVGGIRRLILDGPRMPRTPRAIDVRDRGWAARLIEPFRTLAADDDHLRVVAAPQFRDAEFVEIVVPAAPLRRELRAFLGRVLVTATFTSLVTGALVWLSLSWFLVRPMRRLTESISRFRENPDDPGARVVLSGRRDEVGRAETELSRMQAEVRAALHSRARLAALGEAVAKINHDLRNMLTSAQIASERLAVSADPRVAQALPRLERALDRAIGLAEGVLAYGRSTEPEPRRSPVALATALAAAGEDAGLSEDGVRLESSVDPEALVSADPEQLHRILVNLMRNAREAIETVSERGGRGRIAVRHERSDAVDLIRLADDGPGVPEKARERLFQAFGSGRKGGTGLGLAIARELAQGHGGEVILVSTGPQGSVFEVRLPR
jgi:signal transduction histidine kinase